MGKHWNPCPGAFRLSNDIFLLGLRGRCYLIYSSFFPYHLVPCCSSLESIQVWSCKINYDLTGLFFLPWTGPGNSCRSWQNKCTLRPEALLFSSEHIPFSSVSLSGRGILPMGAVSGAACSLTFSCLPCTFLHLNQNWSMFHSHCCPPIRIFHHWWTINPSSAWSSLPLPQILPAS